MRIKIVGCGLSGITFAALLKNKHKIDIFESREHIGGNCFDHKIGTTMVQAYGPHIFHTSDKSVFEFLSRYTEWVDFKYQPKGDTEIGILSLPYSKKTIKEIGRELSKDEIIRYLFKDYSEKQWGMQYEEIPKSIINRVPEVKESEDPTWFDGQEYQCLPRYGYTAMFQEMLNGVNIILGCDKKEWEKHDSDFTIYTGKIDEYFGYRHGTLQYRSLRFENSHHDKKMETFVINQNRKEVPFIRIYDHSFITPGHVGGTIITREFSLDHDNINIPFYPVPTGENSRKYSVYRDITQKEKILFSGRLASYSYLDMWQTVKHAMIQAENIS